MTTLKRRVLVSSLVATGLMLSSGVTLAADFDVSSIYGRGAPPNVHSRMDSASTTVTHASSDANTAGSSTSPEYQSADSGTPEVQQAYEDHASRTVHPSSTAGADHHAYNSTGRIHDEPLDGKPLTDGRGMREGVDQYATAPVYVDPAFDVSAILGRASPPAPESAPAFGIAG